MTNDEKTRKRQAALNFALETYSKIKHNRTHALSTQQAKIGFAALARAMFDRRIAEDRDGIGAKPTPQEEFSSIIRKLADAGVNVLQKRPGDAPPTLKPWLDPVTGTALPNPWVTKDLRAQSLLQKRDPALAEHYKKMSSDPYGTLAAYQDAEAARTALAQIPYGENEHAVNPFRTNDQTAQAAFVKNAPPGLVEFCKSEAHDVEVPLFGKNRNLTIEGRLAKDPEMGGLIKIGQQIYENWRAEDKMAAEAQRAAANEAIRRLEASAAA